MQIGHKNATTTTQRMALLLRNSWRLALMGMLFAMTCWEVSPGEMPLSYHDSVRPEASGAIEALKTRQGK